jgi:beta-N-acetylhexosaminidase
VDSHELLPEVAIDELTFEQTDLYPYQALLKEADSVMVAHAAYPNLSLQETDRSGRLLPSSLSSNFINSLLRDQLRYDGVVITDDLEMGAIIKNFGIGEASKLAINAGCDMLAICADPDAIREGHKAVCDAVRDGEITEEQLDRAIERLTALKGSIAARSEFNQQRLDGLAEEIAAFNAELAS